MIKLIATDLDGTLMAPDHLTVTDRTYNALKTCLLYTSDAADEL